MGEVIGTIPEELEDEYVQKAQEVIDIICEDDVELYKLLNDNTVLISSKRRLTRQERIEGAFKRKIALMQEFIDGRRNQKGRG
jgi:hypothetical protein